MASAPATVAKAHLTPIDPKVGGSPAGKRIEFQFNPKEYTVSKKAKWEQKPSKGKKSPTPQFTGAEPASTSLELLLDGFERMDGGQPSISQQVDALFKLVAPTGPSVRGQKPVPNWVLFGWGERAGDPYIVESVQVKYTMFQSNGTPVRAVCTIALKEAPIEADKQNPTSGGTTSLRSHLVVAGDSLASVSYGEYGDAGMWRLIAQANGIDNPIRLIPGNRLLIPQIDSEVLV